MVNNIEDILLLPFFEYPTKSLIPNEGSVYFIFSEMELLYIGCTANLRNRICTHNVLQEIKSDYNNLRIHYFAHSSHIGFLELEKKLIRKLNPSLNKRLYRGFFLKTISLNISDRLSNDVETLINERRFSEFVSWCLSQGDLVKRFKENSK